jgi:hypothetical protein
MREEILGMRFRSGLRGKLILQIKVPYTPMDDHNGIPESLVTERWRDAYVSDLPVVNISLNCVTISDLKKIDSGG